VPSGDASFRQFKTMEYGYAAMFTLLACYLRTGRNTVDRIIRSWAPPSENNTLSYVGKVERLSGVPRYQALTAGDGERLVRIVAAMAQVENGTAADMAQVKAGFVLQDDIR
jgi:hypothetical protein